MAFKIIWSAFAETQLDEIYQYYKDEASETIAKKLLQEIIQAPNRLINNPHIGQEELLLKNREIQYRYLIYKNYKIIYAIDDKNSLLKIADVFDSRQNPTKLKRVK
ncbi:type II toxin-antitoxin system RelE/ParE family toxin [Kordia algicida OT-1]|uniref:Hypothetical plasmid-stabilisation protein n=1 Tax=Kordia algicida OT-1 TaxID=391587 RepID=A9DP41_9FLAO|nr:type II toxin-antitoxin system RelE/ParE family toxin [Kordia algicida]EDP97349.1 hypothetical plasmid-stabilisation protein [Kordia algicida OT-1]